MKIVISRFEEDLRWTHCFNPADIIVFNKGKSYVHGAHVLDNVGREGHTYFHYIVNNYDNLPENICFLQGYPFDHSPNLFQNLSKIMQQPELKNGFQYLSENFYTCNLLYCKQHPNLPLFDTYVKLFENSSISKTQDIQFGSGAQFVVSRENILQRPKSFYVKLVKMLSSARNPIEGYVIERFQKLIFDIKSNL